MVADHEQGNVVLPAPVSDEAAQLSHPEAAPDKERAIPVGIEDNRDLKAEAGSLQHLVTHFAKNPYCPGLPKVKNDR